ncbi:hypothetical protein SBADM41S_02424 [Streptomyces badius]
MGSSSQIDEKRSGEVDYQGSDRVTFFLGLGIAGVVLLALSLIFDGVLEGLFGGVVDGLFDGLLSLPVIAGFISMLGFGGAIVLGATSAGTLVATVVGVAAGWWRAG